MKFGKFSLFLRFVLKNVSSILDGFNIEFVKLKDGEHIFHYNLKGEFFEAFEHQEVRRADIAVTATLEKLAHHIKVDLLMEGSLGMACDRCLEVIDFPIDTQYFVFFELQVEQQRVIPDFENQDDQELVIVSYQDTTINFARQMYETILLGIPMLRNCDNLEVKVCNNEMLKKLEQLKQNGEEESDPRWDKLKDLLK